jgi:nitrogen-specific signal transduction histidine kinase
MLSSQHTQISQQANHGLFFYVSFEELQNYLDLELPPVEKYLSTRFIFAVRSEKFKKIELWATTKNIPLENIEFIDADEVAKEIHVDGKYLPNVFQEKVGSLVRSVVFSGKSPWIFGEIVDVLCEDGFADVAARLEYDWNILLEQNPFYLLCGYNRSNFSQVGVDLGFERVCNGHNKHLSLSCGHVALEKKGILKIEHDNFLLNNQLKENFENRALAEMGRIHGDFLHELKNILVVSNINLTRIHQLEGLFQETGKEKFQKALGGLLVAQERLNQIVKEGSDLVKLHPSFWVRFSLSALIERAAILLEDTLNNDRISLGISCESLFVNGNENLLEQVLLNFLEFSRLSFREGRVDQNREISINLRKVNGAAEIEIIDNGDGIKSEHIGRLFEPFYTSKILKSGAGIGLAYCKKIVSAHSGDILCRSLEGSGTTIKIVLPISPEPKFE